MRHFYNLVGGSFLRFHSRFDDLRRVPILAKLLHWASYKVLPAKVLVWTRVSNGEGRGLWVKVYPRTGSHYYRGYIEPEVQQLLQEYLRPGMIFYDIGANIGFFTMIAARLVEGEGKVFAFEPEVEAVCRLKENAARNGLTNISVVDAAVWSRTGCVSFHRCDPRSSTDRGLGRVVVSGTRENTILVPSVALDDFVATALAPDFIKCDVEGAEVEVFRGASNLLTQHKPIVVCEIHSSDQIPMLQELFETFGYRVWLLNNHRLVAKA